jgi:hypothetical protein
MILEFSVKEQTIEMLPTRSIPRKGSRNYLELRFHMAEDWNELLSTAFLQYDSDSEPIPITNKESIVVPTFFSTKDYFQLFVLGINGDQAVPTNMITVNLPATGEAWTSKPEGPNVPDYQALIQLVQAAINEVSQRGSGIYIGSGEMPEGYNVQIDPEGEVLDLASLQTDDDVKKAIEEALEGFEPPESGGGITEERVIQMISEALGVVENGTY